MDSDPFFGRRGSGGPLTPEILREACDRILNAPPPIPCGCDGNPHLVHPRPIGDVTYCISCGYTGVRVSDTEWRGLNAKESEEMDRAFKAAIDSLATAVSESDEGRSL